MNQSMSSEGRRRYVLAAVGWAGVLEAPLEGARFARSSIAVLQDRSGPGRSSFDAGKLLDDARGSALVAALDSLLGKNLLAWRRSLSTEHVAHVSAIYVAEARARFEAIRRSEDRARDLLDQIFSWIRAPEGRPGLLRHWTHAGALDQLRGSFAPARKDAQASTRHAEALLTHVVELRARLERIGRSPSALLDEEENASATAPEGRSTLQRPQPALSAQVGMRKPYPRSLEFFSGRTDLFSALDYGRWNRSCGDPSSHGHSPPSLAPPGTASMAKAVSRAARRVRSGVVEQGARSATAKAAARR